MLKKLLFVTAFFVAVDGSVHADEVCVQDFPVESIEAVPEAAALTAEQQEVLAAILAEQSQMSAAQSSPAEEQNTDEKKRLAQQRRARSLAVALGITAAAIAIAAGWIYRKEIAKALGFSNKVAPESIEAGVSMTPEQAAIAALKKIQEEHETQGFLYNAHWHANHSAGNAINFLEGRMATDDGGSTHDEAVRELRAARNLYFRGEPAIDAKFVQVLNLLGVPLEESSVVVPVGVADAAGAAATSAASMAHEDATHGSSASVSPIPRRSPRLAARTTQAAQAQ